MCAIPAGEEFITEFGEFPFFSPNSVHAFSPFSVNHIFFHWIQWHFSFTGGYSAHTSFNALLTCQKVSLKNNFLTCKISRMISIVLIKDSFVPTDCCLSQYEKWDRLKLFDTSLFGEAILFNWLMYIFNYKRITSKLQRTLLTKRWEESKAQLCTSTISAFAQLSYFFPLSPP